MACDARMLGIERVDIDCIVYLAGVEDLIAYV
jgi:hypothetical protein